MAAVAQLAAALRRVNGAHGLLGSCLAGLAADLLALVADALALVGLGRSHRAKLGGDLADDFSLSAPSIFTIVLFSTEILIPFGASYFTGCENPTMRFTP